MTPFILSFKAKHELVDIDDINCPIYRVIEVSRLIDIFESRRLTLTSPRLWDDPYENFLKYCRGISVIGEEKICLNYEGYSKLIFGQCWTLNEENDGLWRIYSPNKDRAKVKTTIAKLFDVLKKIDDRLFLSFIGKVKYKDEEDIRTNILSAMKEFMGPFSSRDRLIKEYYLIKRKAFSYENEIRLMVHLKKKDDFINAPRQDPYNLDICNLPLENPEELFDEIVFDPRMPDSLVRAFTLYFNNQLNFRKDIHKSHLYQTPIFQGPARTIFDQSEKM